MSALYPYQDSTHPGNSPRYRTGRNCIAPGCQEPAGTKWSPLWCFAHNVIRMDHIGNQLRRLAERQKETP